MVRVMGTSALRRASLAVCLAAAAITGIGTAATAQSAAALEAERAAVFARMLDAPADRALMAHYARLSIQLRDFEAAAATLERLIDLEPANATARLELATAYFAMGNYPLAEYHLNAAAASGALSPEQLASVEAYRGAAAERDAPSRFSGSVAAGIVSADGQIGVLGTGALTWSLDLGDANVTRWVTQIGLSTYQLDADPGASTSDRLSFRVRTGPQFQLTGEAFGPRLQPYVELRSVRYPDAATSDYDAFFVGLAYQNAHSAAWSSFGDASIGWGALDASGADIDFHDVSLGVTYRPSREAFYRLTLSMGSEDTATRQEDQHGLRFDYGRDFDGPAAMPGADWRAGAFASVDWLDITDTGVARDETVTATGLSLRAYLNDDVYVETRGTHLARDGGTNADETVFSMQLGLEF
jgi:tetratricopeptide (TPR) repeat protein